MKRIIGIILNVLFVLIGISLFLYFGPKKVELGKEVSLKPYQSAKIDDFTVKFLKVSDSRCDSSSKVQCIWQGEVSYEVKMDKKQEEISTIKRNDIEYKNYIITLTENTSSKEMKFVVRKK